MMDPFPINAEARDALVSSLTTLRSSNAEISRISKLASRRWKVPISTIYVQEGSRSWIQANFGIGFPDIRQDSFCCDMLASPSASFVVYDVLEDDRFRTTDSVHEAPLYRFKAGASIQMNGVRVGMFCIMDTTSRTQKEFSERDRVCLEEMSGLVSDHLHRRFEEHSLKQQWLSELGYYTTSVRVLEAPLHLLQAKAQAVEKLTQKARDLKEVDDVDYKLSLEQLSHSVEEFNTSVQATRGVLLCFCQCLQTSSPHSVDLEMRNQVMNHDSMPLSPPGRIVSSVQLQPFQCKYFFDLVRSCSGRTIHDSFLSTRSGHSPCQRYKASSLTISYTDSYPSCSAPSYTTYSNLLRLVELVCGQYAELLRFGSLPVKPLSSTQDSSFHKLVLTMEYSLPSSKDSYSFRTGTLGTVPPKLSSVLSMINYFKGCSIMETEFRESEEMSDKGEIYQSYHCTITFPFYSESQHPKSTNEFEEIPLLGSDSLSTVNEPHPTLYLDEKREKCSSVISQDDEGKDDSVTTRRLFSSTSTIKDAGVRPGSHAPPPNSSSTSSAAGIPSLPLPYSQTQQLPLNPPFRGIFHYLRSLATCCCPSE